MSLERQLERETELLDQLTGANIQAIRSQVPADRMGPECCAECGETIHVERRIRGYHNCIDCAQAAEIQARRFAGVRR